jgi:hypothetical protein
VSKALYHIGGVFHCHAMRNDQLLPPVWQRDVPLNDASMPAWCIKSTPECQHIGAVRLPVRLATQRLFLTLQDQTVSASTRASRSNASGWTTRRNRSGVRTDFSPRFGFAYRLPGKTVVRSSYGVFHAGTSLVGINGQAFVQSAVQLELYVHWRSDRANVAEVPNI